ncbi:MAG TPA: serine hydrolase [Bdellovibrionales bacterium]|nr:serine hydrolase [Bdellovibrionales bacterium]
MSQLEHRFLEKLGDQWETATPGFCLQAFHKGKKIADIEVGETWPIYDLASLTKIIFTTTSMMYFFDEKKFKLTDPISKWIDWFPKNHPAKLKNLLSHSAGLLWWYPFYKDLSPLTKDMKSPEQAWRRFEEMLREKMLSDWESSKAKPVDNGRGPTNFGFPPEKAVYSDLDFFCLGLIEEKMAEMPFYDLWQKNRDRMGLQNTDFNRNNKPKGSLKKYAPTEDCAWRGKVLVGEVHDQNTWSMRGVAPHAGLFGPIEDVSKYGLMLRSAMRGKKVRGFPSPATVKLFTKRAIPRTQGDWALGFMMPSRPTTSCGLKFSRDSVGHTGYTGTSLWYDPKKDLLITILSNRVHPSDENKTFQQLRPILHTLITEEL